MKSLFALAIFCITCISQAQVTVFNTFEDFQAEKGETYDEYVKYTIPLYSFTLKLKNGGKATKIKAADIWGFTYGDNLFRIERDKNLPVMVLSFGKIVFYGNGPAFMDMIKKKTSTASFYYGYHGYLSKDINSPIYPVATRRDGKLIAGDPYVLYKKFKESHPEYASLFNCLLGLDISTDMMLECVKKFEAEE